MEKVERKEKGERQRKINESKYNETYKNILTEELPKYLKGRRKRKDRSLIARCGNEIRGGQYWRKEEDRRCRICWHAEETIRHVLKECEKIRSGLEIEEFLGEDGKGLELMKTIEKREERKREIGEKIVIDERLGYKINEFWS